MAKHSARVKVIEPQGQLSEMSFLDQEKQKYLAQKVRPVKRGQYLSGPMEMVFSPNMSIIKLQTCVSC